MLVFSGTARIFLCKDPVDLRKGFEGLSGLIEILFEETLTSGAYFVFVNRQRNMIKVLYWDGDGLAIWQKRLEKGLFKRQAQIGQIMERRQFLMMLEGVEPKRLQKRFKI